MVQENSKLTNAFYENQYLKNRLRENQYFVISDSGKWENPKP